MFLKKLHYFTSIFLFISTHLAAQDLPSHPVFDLNYVLKHKIDEVIIQDSFAVGASQFSTKTLTLDFDRGGLLVKTVHLFNNSPDTREMWYYYYNNDRRLVRKEARYLTDTIRQQIEWTIDTLRNLPVTKIATFRDENGEKQGEKQSTLHWTGDSVCIEHYLNDGKFDITKFDAQRREIELVNTYQKKYNENNQIEWIKYIDCRNKEAKAAAVTNFIFDAEKRLIRIEEGDKTTTKFSYNANGHVTRQVVTDAKGKTKSITTFTYAFY
ncbi:MAG: hypothetical protein RL757_2253 [Bacteroidota bacterium]|jgi:YD repeat-containing protein